MSYLLTQCPFCQTSFKVSEAQMHAANGVVRCGSCMEVFLAGQHRIILKEKPPVTTPAAEQLEQEEYSVPEGADISEHEFPSESYPDIQEFPDEQGSSITETETDDGEILAEQDTSFTGPEFDDEVEARINEEEVNEEAEAGFTPWDDDISPVTSTVIVTEDAENEALAAEEFSPEQEENLSQAIESPHSPQNRPESPEFATYLNPAGYRMSSLELDCTLPSAIGSDPVQDREEVPVNPDSEIELDSEEDFIGNGENDFTFFDIAIIDDKEVTESGFEEDNDSKAATDIYTTAESIPTLQPDVVARETIPESLGAQTLAWFRSLRKSPARNATDLERDTDEKTAIRNTLAELQDEDSLEPVTSENLAAMDTEPVELTNIKDPLNSLKSTALLFGCSILAIALGGQYFWFNLDKLLQENRFSGITSRLCEFSDCSDEQQIDLSTLVTEELLVLDHPSISDALLVNFIFRNEANHEQLFPLVELNVTDNGGSLVANRLFTAEEYLPPEMQLFTHMPAHSSLQVSLELATPGETATGYSLVFRNPR